MCVKRSEDDDFLILGTDGVWDVMENQVRYTRMQVLPRFCIVPRGAQNAGLEPYLKKCDNGVG